MAIDRMTRVNELLQREIASSLHRMELGETVDRARLTVTHVITSPDLRKSRILVSYLGSEEEGEEAVRCLNRKRKVFQELVGRHVALKYTPHLLFALDTSIAEGNRVLDILDHLPPPGPDSDGPQE